MYSKFNSKAVLLFALISGIGASLFGKLYFDLGLSLQVLAGIIVALVLFISCGYLRYLIVKGWRALNNLVDNTAIEVLIGGSAGLMAGVLIGLLSSFPLSMIEGAGTYLTIGTFLLFGYMGLMIGTHRAIDVWSLFPGNTKQAAMKTTANNKVLDTSAIIDGRIYDVCQSKFLEGPLVVPIFVIEELQHIADSSEYLRRNKGRRGLELLSKMQKHPGIKIDIIESNIPEEKEVDMKLLRLCKQMDASIITNDYNLNKVAELQGIKVLNINELTNAVKVVVYPGETMNINVLKEGKEPGQGVGYLEDGTMVVVEDAQDELGNHLEVVVTSVFQTAAGRMIFTRKVKEEAPLIINHSLSDVKMQEVNIYG